MKNLVFAIQPLFSPWIGFYDMIDLCDKLVILDDVQFNTRSWQQRNRIMTSAGLEWLTVPVRKKNLRNQKINEVQLNEVEKFVNLTKKKFIYNYSKSKYFNEYYIELIKLFEKCNTHKSLIELNLDILNWTLLKLRISKKFTLSSSLNLQVNSKVDRVIKICQKFNSKRYLCNIGAKDYLIAEKDLIKLNKIEIFSHNYCHPKYNQLYNTFIEYASSLDLLFNEGPNSYEIIKSGSKKLLKII